ncbi:MAG: hypothetical protein V4760_12960 [Bdellovibrionota bacterium]
MAKYGPFSVEEIDSLKAVFDRHGIRFENPLSGVDPDVVEEEAAESGGWTATFIELDDEMYQLVKPQLAHMERAVPVGEGSEELVDEYLCLRCDHVSNLPGQCPTHGDALIEFSEITKVKAEQSSKLTKTFFYLVVTLAALGYSIYALRQ